MTIIKTKKTVLTMGGLIIALVAILAQFITFNCSNGFCGFATKNAMDKYHKVAPLVDQLQTTAGIRQYILNELDTTYELDNQIVQTLK